MLVYAALNSFSCTSGLRIVSQKFQKPLYAVPRYWFPFIEFIHLDIPFMIRRRLCPGDGGNGGRVTAIHYSTSLYVSPLQLKIMLPLAATVSVWLGPAPGSRRYKSSRCILNVFMSDVSVWLWNHADGMVGIFNKDNPPFLALLAKSRGSETVNLNALFIVGVEYVSGG